MSDLELFALVVISFFVVFLLMVVIGSPEPELDREVHQQTQGERCWLAERTACEEMSDMPKMGLFDTTIVESKID
jgi:hypothetical protein